MKSKKHGIAKIEELSNVVRDAIRDVIKAMAEDAVLDAADDARVDFSARVSAGVRAVDAILSARSAWRVKAEQSVIASIETDLAKYLACERITDRARLLTVAKYVGSAVADLCESHSLQGTITDDDWQEVTKVFGWTRTTRMQLLGFLRNDSTFLRLVADTEGTT